MIYSIEQCGISFRWECDSMEKPVTASPSRNGNICAFHRRFIRMRWRFCGKALNAINLSQMKNSVKTFYDICCIKKKEFSFELFFYIRLFKKKTKNFDSLRACATKKRAQIVLLSCVFIQLCFFIGKCVNRC